MDVNWQKIWYETWQVGGGLQSRGGNATYHVALMYSGIYDEGCNWPHMVKMWRKKSEKLKCQLITDLFSIRDVNKLLAGRVQQTHSNLIITQIIMLIITVLKIDPALWKGGEEMIQTKLSVRQIHLHQQLWNWFYLRKMTNVHLDEKARTIRKMC